MQHLTIELIDGPSGTGKTTHLARGLDSRHYAGVFNAPRDEYCDYYAPTMQRISAQLPTYADTARSLRGCVVGVDRSPLAAHIVSTSVGIIQPTTALALTRHHLEAMSDILHDSLPVPHLPDESCLAYCGLGACRRQPLCLRLDVKVFGINRLTPRYPRKGGTPHRTHMSPQMERHTWRRLAHEVELRGPLVDSTCLTASHSHLSISNNGG